MLQRSPRAGGLIGPCLPSPAKAPPSGPDWLHEIEHDGFRIMARRDAKGVRLRTRNGNDFSKRFPAVVAGIAALPARSCLIDGEAIVSDETGLAVFELIRSFRHDHAAVLCAFDLLELDGEDLRRLPIEQRKQTLVRLLHGPYRGLALNEHYVGDGEIVFQQACRLGCEGIVRREAEEDWGR
jgi:ATP-dependent DNA ligase